MKRVDDEEEKEDIFSCLGSDLTLLIISPLYIENRHLPSVSHFWKKCLYHYTGWFDLAKILYKPLYFYSTIKVESILVKYIDIPEKNVKQFVQYGGIGRNLRDSICIDKNYLMRRDRFGIDLSRLMKNIEIVFYYFDTYLFSEDTAFKNHISRLLVAKYQSIEKRSHQKIISCPSLVALLDYVEKESASFLVRRNFHWRDINITFREHDHRYTIDYWDKEKERFLTVRSYRDLDDNESLNRIFNKSYTESEDDVLRYDLRSGTTFISSLFEEFNEDEAIANMHNKKESDEEIKEKWAAIREEASVNGTAMHLTLEYDSLGIEHETESKEWKLFEQYSKAILHGRLRAYRPEWRIYDEELMLCGTVDILYEEWPKRNISCRDPKKTYLVLGDYKRSKEIKEFNPYQSGIPECEAVAHVGDCNYMHYMIQLSLYKYILEKNYNVIILRMFIIVLHPNQSNYLKVDMQPPVNFIESIIAYRRRTLIERKCK